MFRERLSERFCRMSEFWLLGCQVTFRWDDLIVFHLQLARHNDIVPVTRDYLYKDLPEAPRRIQENEFECTG